jgi:hypothetical protein
MGTRTSIVSRNHAYISIEPRSPTPRWPWISRKIRKPFDDAVPALKADSRLRRLCRTIAFDSTPPHEKTGTNSRFVRVSCGFGIVKGYSYRCEQWCQSPAVAVSFLLGEEDSLLDGSDGEIRPVGLPLCFTHQTERCYGQNPI